MRGTHTAGCSPFAWISFCPGSALSAVTPTDSSAWAKSAMICEEGSKGGQRGLIEMSVGDQKSRGKGGGGRTSSMNSIPTETRIAVAGGKEERISPVLDRHGKE